MNEGSVALSALPQADGEIKIRPVILLKRMPGFGDWLTCGISTQLRQAIPGFDEVIDESASDFSSSGLKAASVIRLGFLAALPETSIAGEIGWVSAERQQRLLKRLADYLAASSLK